MSLPSFPKDPSELTREDVINQILSSIAMEELGLSHIINTEGEKMQYALGTIPDVPKPTEPLTFENLLDLNKSVTKTLDSAMINQLFLKGKMDSALSASTMKGDPGAGIEILGSYDTLDELNAAHPTGKQGEVYSVDGVLHYWDEAKKKWEPIKNLHGPEGPEGPPGTGTTIKGKGESKAQLDRDYPDGPPENAYIVDGEIYIWNAAEGWHSGGSLRGPEGPKGDKGDQGPKGDSGSAFTVIPFASQQAPYVSTNTTGDPTTVALIGFGYMEYSNFGAASGQVAIPIDNNDGSFNLSLDTGKNRQVAFSLPFDMKLNTIYATVGNYDKFLIPPQNTRLFPYVQVYAAMPGTNNFEPLTDAYAKPDQWIDPYSADPATMRSASKTGLDIELTAGTRIAIGGLMEITGDNSTRSYYLYFTGGLGLTPWIR